MFSVFLAVAVRIIVWVAVILEPENLTSKLFCWFSVGRDVLVLCHVCLSIVLLECLHSMGILQNKREKGIIFSDLVFRNIPTVVLDRKTSHIKRNR